MVLGALAANAAEITINVGEGQTFAYAIDDGELISTGDEGPAKVTFAANRNATYSFYEVAKNGTATLIELVAVTDAEGETVSETADANVAVDTRAEKEIDASAGEVKVDLTCSGDNWGEAVGGSAAITLAIGEGEAKPYRTGLTGNGTVPWTPPIDGTYVFTHTVGEAEETATFNVVGFPGGEGRPWEIGAEDAASVTAYVKDGYLYLEGKGEVAAFTGDAPWAGLNDMLEGIGPLSRAITVPASVLETLPISVKGGEQVPSGAIGGAEFEQVKIVGGKVYLAVSVCTNGDVTAATEDWQKAAIEGVQVEKDGTVTLTVPATAEQGFMFLKSKGAEK